MPFQHKNKSERLREVIKILKIIQNLGLSNENEGIKKLNKILKQWMKDGVYQKGKIKLYGFEREILYELYTRQGTEIAVNLKFVKGL